MKPTPPPKFPKLPFFHRSLSLVIPIILLYFLAFFWPLNLWLLPDSPSIKMSLSILTFLAFASGFIEYFYKIIALSPAQLLIEKRKLYRPPPSLSFIILKIIFALTFIFLIHFFHSN